MERYSIGEEAAILQQVRYSLDQGARCKAITNFSGFERILDKNLSLEGRQRLEDLFKHYGFQTVTFTVVNSGWLYMRARDRKAQETQLVITEIAKTA